MLQIRRKILDRHNTSANRLSVNDALNSFSESQRLISTPAICDKFSCTELPAKWTWEISWEWTWNSYRGEWFWSSCILSSGAPSCPLGPFPVIGSGSPPASAGRAGGLAARRHAGAARGGASRWSAAGTPWPHSLSRAGRRSAGSRRLHFWYRRRLVLELFVLRASSGAFAASPPHSLWLKTVSAAPAVASSGGRRSGAPCGAECWWLSSWSAPRNGGSRWASEQRSAAAAWAQPSCFGEKWRSRRAHRQYSRPEGSPTTGSASHSWLEVSSLVGAIADQRVISLITDLLRVRRVTGQKKSLWLNRL